MHTYVYGMFFIIGVVLMEVQEKVDLTGPREVVHVAEVSAADSTEDSMAGQAPWATDLWVMDLETEGHSTAAVVMETVMETKGAMVVDIMLVR